MKQSLLKWLSRLMMTLIAMAVGVPLSQAAVTVNVKATDAPYVYAWFYDNNNVKVEPLGAWPGTLAAAAQNFQGEAVWHVDINNVVLDDGTNHTVSFIVHNGGGQPGDKTGDITGMGNGLYEYSYDGYTKLTPIEICRLDNGYVYGHLSMAAPYGTFVLDYRDSGSFGYISTDNMTYNKVYAWNSSTQKVYTAAFPGDDLSTIVNAPRVELRGYHHGGYTYDAQDYYAFDFTLEANDPGPDHVIFVDSNSAYEENGSTQYSTRTGDLPFFKGAVFDNTHGSTPEIKWTIKPSRDIDATLIPNDFVRKVITGEIVDMDDSNNVNIDLNHDGKLSNYELLSAWAFGYYAELPEKWDEYEQGVDPTNLPAITSLAGLEIFPYLNEIYIEYPLGENLDEDEDSYSEFSLRSFGYSEGNLGDIVIPALPYLGYLTLNNCGVTSIDLSNVPNVYELQLTGNRLTSIDLSNCTGLYSLLLSDNQIPANGITGLNKVQKLNLSRNPITTYAPVSSTLNDLAMDVCQLTSLDLSGVPLLNRLSASSNQLQSIDLTHNPQLHEILLSRNHLSSIDLSGQANVLNYYDYGLELNISYNNFSTIDLHPVASSLRYLTVSGNNLGTLDLSNLTNLEDLNASSCNLTSITLPSTLKDNNEICLSGNNLNNLDLSYVTNLRELYAARNPLGTLTLGSQPALRTLWAPTAQLTELDLSQCTMLRDIYLSHNQLNETNTQWPPAFTNNGGSPAPRHSIFKDLSQRLQERATAKRQHEQLSGKANVSGPRREQEVYRGIEDLYLTHNEFRTLDLEGMPNLEYLFSSHNQLSALDLSNQSKFEEGFAEMVAYYYGNHPDYDDYVSPMYMFNYDGLSKELCNQIASYGYTAEQIPTIKGANWMGYQEDIIRDVATDPSVYNDLGAGNRREVTPEWGTRNGDNVYFIRLDNEAAGTQELLSENTFLGPDFVMDNAGDWTNAQVVNDPDYGNILLLTATGESDGNATGEVTYSYDTNCPQESADDMMKSVTFGFTWTAPASTTVNPVTSDLSLTPGDGTVYGGYTQVVITIPDGVTVTVTIDGETVETQTDGTNTYIELPSDNDNGIEGHTVVVTPGTGDPVTATYTFMPTPGDNTHWISVAKESDLDTSKPVFFAEFDDMTNLTQRGMSIIPVGQDTHVATAETNSASLNVTDEHYYDVTLPYNSTADMYSITPVDGVEHGYNIKSFVSGKYLAFNGTANLVDSDEPSTIYFYGNPNGYYEYGFCDFMAETEQEMDIMRAIYYDVDLGKFMAYTEAEAMARENDGHPFRMVYLFNQTDTKPDAPIFSKAEGSVLRYGTRVKITNNPSNSINGHFTSDNTDPTVLGGEYRLRYKDFISIEHRRQGWKGDEPYMTGTFPTLEGTLTLRAVHSVGYLYSDESMVHYTCPPQVPYTFVQVTDEDQLVAGKRYLVVAKTHDKEGDWNHVMGACTDDDPAAFDREYSDIPNGFIDLEPWYLSEPYILGGSTGAWTFTDNTFGKYVGATTYEREPGDTRVVPAMYENAADAATFAITLDNDNNVEIDFGGSIGKLTFFDKGYFSYGDESDSDEFLGMMLFVEYEPELAELDAVGGEFSVSADKKIEFSKGNIQYHTGTRQWRAAEHQYDVIGVADNIRLGDPTLSAWVDLFAWSCESVPYGLSPSNKDADYTGDFMDWGENFDGEWTTPTKDEWQYLLTGRANAANLRGEGNVAGMNGLILLPDNWVLPDGMTFLAGYIGWEDENVEDDYLENVYTAAEWEVMEAAGAVFLPNAGSRTGGYGNMWNGAAEATFTNPETGYYSWVDNVRDMGYYWSSTLNPNNSNSVYYLIIPGMNGDFTHYTAPALWTRERRRGNSVRLVREAVQTVEVPMPTFNPAPGTYRGDYLDIAIERAEGHENDRVFFTVAKHDAPADPTINDREYTDKRFRINDGSTVIVKAIAMDADGNFSAVNTGYYYIHEDMPFDFRRANSTADLVPGREFIFVYEDDDLDGADYYDYGALATTPTSGPRNHVGATDPSPADLVDAIVNSNLLVVEKYMGTVCMVRNDVSIFQLGKDGYDYTFYDFNNNKFLASVENSAGLVDGVTADSKFRIQIDASTHAADLSADGTIGLFYDSVNNKYGFYTPNDANNTGLKHVALYYRENNHMTLAEFKNLDTEVEKDYNGDVSRTVTISEPLTVAYVIDAKEPIDALISGYLVLCDNSVSTDRVVTPIAGQEELLIKGAGSYFPKNEIPQELYTQKNWLLVATLNTGLFTGNNTVPSSQYQVGDVIKANTVCGMAYHLLPMVLAYNSSHQPEVDTEAEKQTVVYNTYTPAHFNDDNLNLGQDGPTFKYFMMSPKRMEVANITYAVYKNSPAPGMYTKADEEAEGSFNILFDGNLATGKYGEGEGQNFTSSTNFDDVFTSEEEGNAYEFRGIVWPNEGWDEDGDDGYDDEFVVVYDIDTDNPVFGHAPRNLFKARRLVEKATPSSVSPNSDMNVLIVDIDARSEKNTSVITGIEEVVNADARTIKAVRYYNVGGMESDKPFDGVNIIVTEFNDGSTITEKVLK